MPITQRCFQNVTKRLYTGELIKESEKEKKAKQVTTVYGIRELSPPDTQTKALTKGMSQSTWYLPHL